MGHLGAIFIYLVNKNVLLSPSTALQLGPFGNGSKKSEIFANTEIKNNHVFFPICFLYHLRKKYKSTCLKHRLILCLSKGYDHELFRYQVLGLRLLNHKLYVSRCRSKEYFYWREVGRSLGSYNIVFLAVKRDAYCFLRALHYTFHMKGQHLHSLYPQLNAPLRNDEKDLNKTRKAAIKPRSYLQNSEKVIQTNLFVKSQKDIMSFNLMSNLNG